MKIFLGAFSIFSLFHTGRSFNLIGQDNTIRATHDSTICLYNYNDRHIKSKTCDSEISLDSTWEYLPSGQIKAGTTPTDTFSKCWQISSRRNKPQNKALKLKDCDESNANQIFTYNKGRVSQEIDGVLYCLKIIEPSGNIRIVECEHGFFGESSSEICLEDEEELMDENATVESFTANQLLVGSSHTCTPSFDITCSPSGCTLKNATANCQEVIVEQGLCMNKNLGGTPLRIALWNVQILGDSKANKIGVMRTFLKVFENFDIVGISELRDADQSGGETFFNDYLNVDGNGMGSWDRVYGERDGSYKPETDKEVSAEQTIFFWRTDKVELVKHTTFRDFKDDFYVRGPQAGHFKRLDTGYEFTVVQMHLSAGSLAISQADYLVDLERVLTQGGSMVNSDGEVIGPIIDETQPDNLYPSSIIFGGDLNADDPYITTSALPNLAMRLDNSYKWLINDDADTNVASGSEKAYDRIIIHNDMVNAACDSSYSYDANTVDGYDHGTLRFTEYWEEVLADWLVEFPDEEPSSANGLDKEERVSDHWPVWFTIY